MDAVKREISEETGRMPMRIKKFNIKGKYKYEKPLADRQGFVGQTYSLYSAELKKEKIKVDKKEHSKYKWVDFKTANEKLTWENQKKCLRVVEKWLNK